MRRLQDHDALLGDAPPDAGFDLAAWASERERLIVEFLAAGHTAEDIAELAAWNENLIQRVSHWRRIGMTELGAIERNLRFLGDQSEEAGGKQATYLDCQG